MLAPASLDATETESIWLQRIYFNPRWGNGDSPSSKEPSAACLEAFGISFCHHQPVGTAKGKFTGGHWFTGVPQTRTGAGG